jgi:hypothetical protein
VPLSYPTCSGKLGQPANRVSALVWLGGRALPESKWWSVRLITINLIWRRLSGCLSLALVSTAHSHLAPQVELGRKGGEHRVGRAGQGRGESSNGLAAVLAFRDLRHRLPCPGRTVVFRLVVPLSDVSAVLAAVGRTAAGRFRLVQVIQVIQVISMAQARASVRSQTKSWTAP